MRLRLLLLFAAAVPAVAEDLGPVDDLRFGVTAQMSPTVTEKLSGPGTPSKNYGWEDAKAYGIRFDATYYQGMSRRGRALAGFLWAAGLSYGTTDITPQSYDVGGSTYTNSRDDLTLSYKQYGAMGAVGWSSQPSITELGDLHWEVLAVGRGGYATAQTINPGLNPTVSSGGGEYWEIGPQASYVLCDEHWLAAINLGWLYGQSKINISEPNGFDSELTILRNGLEAGLMVGYRF